jgi:hypothetical protein
LLLSRNYKTILNRSRESGQSYLIPDFNGNSFSCSPFSMMLAQGLSYFIYYFIILRNIPSIPSFFRAFVMKGYWILSKAFFCVLKRPCFFFPCFCLYAVLHLWIYICQTILASLKWNQLGHGVWSFEMLLNSVSQYFVGIHYTNCIFDNDYFPCDLCNVIITFMTFFLLFFWVKSSSFFIFYIIYLSYYSISPL